MNKKMTKAACAGCRDDFYNHNRMGLNESGGQPECWSFKDAKMEKRIVIHRDQRPPYKDKPEWKPSCWYGRNGLRAIKPEVLNGDGYWKSFGL